MPGVFLLDPISLLLPGLRSFWVKQLPSFVFFYHEKMYGDGEGKTFVDRECEG